MLGYLARLALLFQFPNSLCFDYFFNYVSVYFQIMLVIVGTNKSLNHYSAHSLSELFSDRLHQDYIFRQSVEWESNSQTQRRWKAHALTNPTWIWFSRFKLRVRFRVRVELRYLELSVLRGERRLLWRIQRGFGFQDLNSEFALESGLNWDILNCLCQCR
jgi:hypothetical protein